MYAVGREHPLRAEARRFFEDSLTASGRLCTSAEVLQEQMHAYLPLPLGVPRSRIGHQESHQPQEETSDDRPEQTEQDDAEQMRA